jgi:hypothetical protein
MERILSFAALFTLGCTVIAPFDFTTTTGTPDGGRDRDGGPRVDAFFEQCPAPCFGDLAGDFREMEQGNGALEWRYREDERDRLGVAYDDLVWGSREGRDAFIADDGTPPALLHCDDASDLCAGLEGSVVMVSDSQGAGSDATIELTATEDSVYRIVGNYRTPEGISSTSRHRWVATRKSRLDVVSAIDFFPGTNGAIEIVAPVLAGDPLRLTLVGGTDSVPVALTNLFVTAGPVFPSDCLFAATFDGGDPFVDHCGGAALENATDGSAEPDPGPTTQGASLDASHGNARVFVPGRQVRSLGPPLDYRGDFTVQLWAQIDDANLPFSAALFTDSTSDIPAGGAFISIDTSGMAYVGTYYRDESCEGGICEPYAGVPRPTDGEWHFYRLVRDTSTQTMRFCIDGDEVAMFDVPGDLDLTTEYAPYMGRNVFFNPAYFAGSIDEVRVFGAVLPCGS